MASTQYNKPLFGINIDPSAKNLQLAYTLAFSPLKRGRNLRAQPLLPLPYKETPEIQKAQVGMQ
jgi:hypothetical protein